MQKFAKKLFVVSMNGETVNWPIKRKRETFNNWLGFRRKKQESSKFTKVRNGGWNSFLNLLQDPKVKK
jgi:hypothetical protein